jgi:hypothetical protein
MAGARHDYARQAALYDDTRRASPSILRPLSEALAAADPDELARGLERLAGDLARGRRPDEEVAAARARFGDGAVVAWRKA